MLPNPHRAVIDRDKLEKYLLSSSHPLGRFKAVFFRSLGFSGSDWRRLEAAFREFLHKPALPKEQTKYGRKYLICGTLEGPNGRKADVVTVWIVRQGEDMPRFVTAYPGGCK